jgi:hypothetical protein
MMLENLNDEQKRFLTDLAYVNIPEEWVGENLYDFAIQSKNKALMEFLEREENRHLGNLIIKDYVNNNDNAGSGSGFCAIAFQDPKTGQVGMSFRGTEGLPNPFVEDMRDNYSTALFGESIQSKEAIEFYEANKNLFGNNFIYGHSKGGELTAQVYVHDYENIAGAFTINAQPINPYALTEEQLAALQLDKFDAVIINGDVVSFLGIVFIP